VPANTTQTFIAIDRDQVHCVIEVKMDKEMEAAEVQGKRDAARRWANHVSADEKTVWRYVIVSESDVKTAKGSWLALKHLAGE
jgi:type III restriction enzyme